MGAIQQRVGDGFAHRDAGDLPHHIDLAFDVLDIERGDHIDARIEQFQHVLIAFQVPTAGGVGVGQLID